MAAAADVEKEEIQDLRNPAVTDKYREAAKIAQFTLEAVLKQLEAGKSIADVCEFSDALIQAQCTKAFKTAKVEKGVAFPTCISANECVGHYSPLKGESDAIKAGDVLKIDLGVHIDGYIANVAHTHVVASDGGAAPITGPQADVIAAAYHAAEAAIRMIKPGNTNTQVTETIAKVAEAFGVSPMQGVLMHEMKHYVIDGSKVVLLRGDDPEVKVEEVTFEPNEVYSIDIVMSTGEGKPRETEARTTVFKLAPEASYRPKMKAAQTVQREAMNRFTVMPFTLRALENESQARMGIVELLKHGVVHSYPVLHEREGALLAHVKFTALLLPGGTLKITGLSLPAHVVSEKKLPEDLTALLATVPYQKKVKATA